MGKIRPGKKIGTEEPNQNIQIEDLQIPEWFLYFYIQNNQTEVEPNEYSNI